MRRSVLEKEMAKRNAEMYPVFRKTSSVAAFLDTHKGLKNGEDQDQQSETLSGRIILRRTMGKIIFLTLQEDGSKVQVKITKDSYQDFEFVKEHLRRNDIISVQGHPSRTPRGELTINAAKIDILVPCLHETPDFNHLTDPDLRFRQRYLDMMVNKGVIDVFKTRAKVIKTIRGFLDEAGFTEVETPVLSFSVGGANAKPFLTQSESLNAHMALRIAPELYLKQLVIGGMDRVYEIGKNFRNEGIDGTHNPEFTMCEFYQAYSDYYQLMETTENLLKKIVFEVHNTYTIEVPFPKSKGKTVVIDFSKPFRRISMVEELEKQLQLKLPDLEKDGAVEFLQNICKKYSLEFQTHETVPDLFDTIVGHFIESQCSEPTFLTDYPVFTSPLARRHRSKPGMTERFELFIAGIEVVNSYTELNDPAIQRANFDLQRQFSNKDGFLKNLQTGENEDNYVKALEYGLPPTAGWGMGIDRFVMLLTGKVSIREVVIFPALKPKSHSEQQ
uniref:Lysine--tRNA ligase n=1 Tax=Arcella intermedia TaxID=1963864 RepID=A0A6B2L235_9EUKA